MRGSGDMRQSDDQARTCPKQRKSVSALMSKKLDQDADDDCPFCDVTDVAVLEINHIDGDPFEMITEN